MSEMKLIMEGWHGYLAEADEGPNAGMTWGQLAQAIKMVEEMQQKELSAERKKELHSTLGGVAFNFALSFAGPLGELVKTTKSVGGIVGKLFGTYAKKPDTETANNPLLAALNLHDGFQDLIDDKLEDKFIKELLPQIENQATANPNAPIPNMDNVIKTWIAKERLGGVTGHNIEKPGT